MSMVAPGGICQRCARRGWLLGELSRPLDALAGDPPRLWSVLELGDRELISALAGVAHSDLLERWERWERSSNCDSAQRGVCSGSSRAACRHHCLFPTRLRDDPLAPHALVFDGDQDGRLSELRERKVVAIAGARAASEYGASVARGLAGELAAAGVIVAGSGSGIGAAARAGATAGADSWTLCVIEPGSSRRSRDTRPRLQAGRRECRVVEPVASDGSCRWAAFAAERTLALLADLVLVVQATTAPLELACAGVARSRGVTVAAVPGPVDSPDSRGSNLLLAGGARVVCDSGDALDALFGVGAPAAVACRAGHLC